MNTANMMSRPNGRVQVRWAPRPEVNIPALVVNPSATAAIPVVSAAHLMASSSSRNCTPMPRETMIDGTIRLATVV